jgi:regulator of protease activity HflC (stomatin/prohibitin superfamily)
MKTSKRLIAGASLLGLTLVTGLTATSLFETNDSGNMQIKQAAVTGKISCKLDSGTYLQLFGKITTYPVADTYEFQTVGLDTRFNDGAKAVVKGSFRYVLPSTCERLKEVHRKFNSQNGIEQELINPVAQRAIFSTGPYMSAGESYSERRTEFVDLANDQIGYGIIRTDKVDVEINDDLTGEQKTIKRVTSRPCTDETDNCVKDFERDESALSQYGFSISNFSISEINYDQNVLDQIKNQQEARMNVITQSANAKSSEAKAKAAEADALFQVAQTRAQEEIAKTQQVVRAEAKARVAELSVQEAEYYKKEQILRGQGEAERKRLVLEADGALEQKLEAYVEVAKANAEAIKNYKGDWVPKTVMGSSGQSNGSNAANDMLNLMAVKAAKDLSLDVSVKE